MIEGIVLFLSIGRKRTRQFPRVGLFSGAFPGDPVMSLGSDLPQHPENASLAVRFDRL